MWYENGQKKMNLFTQIKNLKKLLYGNQTAKNVGSQMSAGNGISVAYSSDNQESEMIVYKAGKEIRKEKIDN